ncbi:MULTISPECIES: ATPase, T2SS/T4P/T4SS family [unclassified Pseudomonas]|uniref:ATPase, T2SS/T4P/T4SS family n=2 Tax=Pseudomonas TaxID=286 RepID=UPI002B22EC54|nr:MULTISPECIES: ATPase, T2SS/T4P/T4SS family [unclassified Pseudomonas]MEA9979915.1 ATPase, T2SS/T4P/T4SS family [Pseudomonas sp. RTS4]MEB0198168.1 ATPase, T2SS/T4P/T4SS family [Pseudomonas sp. 5S4]MEB0247843.1 ATPase, T2SS/T4P/T4SS family [Pseudomonas sp. 10S5]
MSRITEADFVDLYLGETFSDVKGLNGASTKKVDAPSEWTDDLVRLKAQCSAHFAEFQDPEFSLIEDGVVLRVTQIVDSLGKEVFAISKAKPKIMQFDSLGFPDSLVATLLDDVSSGLVIFCGEMGAGKTSSAASLVVARLEACGGIAFAMEDPRETNLNGPHGQGRCIQMQVSRRTGGYEEAFLRALRTRADLLFVGEIRDSRTAALVVRASINGHFIITTSHSGSPSQAIEYIAALAQPEISNAREILAQGLLAVIFQTLDKGRGRSTLKVKSLLFSGEDGPGIRQKIRTGNVQQVDQDVENQSKRNIYGSI